MSAFKDRAFQYQNGVPDEEVFKRYDSRNVPIVVDTSTNLPYFYTPATGVQALSADAAAAISAAVAAHEAAANPHPTYLTEAEADAIYYQIGEQALNFRIENRTSDPGSPATGQIWLRTDL